MYLFFCCFSVPEENVKTNFLFFYFFVFLLSLFSFSFCLYLFLFLSLFFPFLPPIQSPTKTSKRSTNQKTCTDQDNSLAQNPCYVVETQPTSHWDGGNHKTSLCLTFPKPHSRDCLDTAPSLHCGSLIQLPPSSASISPPLLLHSQQTSPSRAGSRDKTPFLCAIWGPGCSKPPGAEAEPSCAEHGGSFPVTRPAAPDVLLTSSRAMTHKDAQRAPQRATTLHNVPRVSRGARRTRGLYLPLPTSGWGFGGVPAAGEGSSWLRMESRFILLPQQNLVCIKNSRNSPKPTVFK